MTIDSYLLIAAAATLLLYIVPGARVLGRPLLWLATLVHELGHGFAAMLVGGSFKRLQLHANGSGSASYEGRFGAAGRAFAAAGGPLGPPLAALALFWAATDAQRAHFALWTLAVLFGLVALIWVRNVFGWVFVSLLAAALAVLAWKATADVAQVSCAFMALQMALSAFSRSDYLFKSTARTSTGVMPSDTAQIAAALGGPHWLWGGLIAVASVAVVGWGVWRFAA